MVAKIAETKGIPAEEFDGKQAMELVLDQDEEACKIFDSTMDALAQVAYTVNCVLNPEKICFGGGISRQPYVGKTLEKSLMKLLITPTFLCPKLK